MSISVAVVLIRYFIHMFYLSVPVMYCIYRHVIVVTRAETTDVDVEILSLI